ncbi:MAG: DUF3667 domain-containing protein [Ferruginibacter sp.]
MSSHICPNCNNEFTGQFCNNCGQKVTHRITMRHLVHDFVHAFTHTDKGFFYMMIQLFVRPGTVAREYISEGKRKRYFLPLQYLIIIGAIATIVVTNSHFMEHTMNSMSELTGTAKQYSARQAMFMQKVSQWQSKYYNIMIMLQLPFYALAALVVYRKKYKFNYAELLTLQTFVTAQNTLMATLLMLIAFLGNSTTIYLNVIIAVIAFIYHIMVYMQFFREYSIVGFLKALLSYLLGLLFFFIFSVVLGLLIGFLIAIFS